jgi:hypothetical protein
MLITNKMKPSKMQKSENLIVETNIHPHAKEIAPIQILVACILNSLPGNATIASFQNESNTINISTN